jgi:hypothetical protein
LIECAPTIDQNGVIYTGSADAVDYNPGYLPALFAVNPNGTVKWIYTNSVGFVMSSPAIAADGTVYFGAGDFNLYALNSNGSLAWTYQTTSDIVGSPAILPDGSVLIASEDGNLYCLWGTAPPQADAPWPMFQQSLDHNGQQPPTTFTNTVPYCGAPFVFNGEYSGSTFAFSMTGTPGSSNWNVYASTNLATTNWTRMASNLVMNSVTGNTNFTDSGVTGRAQKFYKVSRSNCCSQAIGFVNETVARGTNLIANQLYQVDENVLNAEFSIAKAWPMNTLNALFVVSNAWGSAQAGTRIYKWNGHGFDGDTNGESGNPFWIGGGDLTLLPGTGVLMNNVTGTAFTTTFVGLIREQQIFQIPQATNHLSPTTNYLSATIPVAGPLTNITGYVPKSGDIVQLWNTSSNKFISHTNTSGSWSNGGLPALTVGQGFVLITTNAYTWTNTWEQCPSP